MEKQQSSALITPFKHKRMMASPPHTHTLTVTLPQGHPDMHSEHTHTISPPLPVATGLFVFNSLLRGGNGDSVTAVSLPRPQRTADQ